MTKTGMYLVYAAVIVIVYLALSPQILGGTSYQLIPEVANPVCMQRVGPEESCSDFNTNTRSYFDRDGDDCVRMPDYVPGDCLPGWTLMADTCQTNPSYLTNYDCDPGYEKVGGYCVPTGNVPHIDVTCLAGEVWDSTKGACVSMKTASCPPGCPWDGLKYNACVCPESIKIVDGFDFSQYELLVYGGFILVLAYIFLNRKKR